MIGPNDSADWLSLCRERISVGTASDWATQPSCGAVVAFAGVARDHSEGRAGVDLLTYEAYEQAALPALTGVSHELRRRWPEVVRVVLIHRIGELEVGDVAVVVAVSAPHRRAAFDAASFGIDAVKASVPIWKRERWADGESWGLEAQQLMDSADIGGEGSNG